MAEKKGRVLIVDDDQDVLVAARMLLKKNDYEARTEPDPYALPALLQAESFDAILLDMDFSKDASSGREGFYWLHEIRALDPAAVVILITAYGDVEMAVRAMKEGATDFVLEPWQNEKLLATVSSAVDLQRSRRATAQLRSRQRPEGIVPLVDQYLGLLSRKYGKPLPTLTPKAIDKLRL